MNVEFRRVKHLSLFAYIEAACYINSKRAPLKYGANTKYSIIASDYFAICRNERALDFELSDIPEEIKNAFMEDVKEILGPFFKYRNENIKYLLDKRVKYCPECIKTGKHYLFNQFKFSTHCYIHNIPLKTTCSSCGKENSIAIVDHMVKTPFKCRECNLDFLEYDKPEQLLVDYWNATDPDNPFHEKSEKSAFIISTKANCNHSSNPKFIEISAYEIPNMFMKRYFEEGILPEPDLTIAKNDTYTKEIDDIILDFVSKKMCMKLKKEGHVQETIEKFIEDNVVEFDTHSKAIFILSKATSLKRDPKYNNFFYVYNNLLQALEPFDVINKNTIATKLMEEYINDYYNIVLYKVSVEAIKNIKSNYAYRFNIILDYDYVIYEINDEYRIYKFIRRKK